MKKLFTLALTAFVYNIASAQPCTPSAPATVFDTYTATPGTTGFYSNMPTGTVLQLEITQAPVTILFDLCATNQGTPPFPAGQNDSYLTILDGNSATATIVGSGDDGCPSTSNGGPTYESISFANNGTYYMYLTDYPCVNNGNTLYTINLETSAGGLAPNNDLCANATVLTIGTWTDASFANTTYDEPTESDPVSGNPISSACAPSIYSSTLVWFSFSAPAGTYQVIGQQQVLSMDLRHHYAVYPAADIDCANPANSDYSRGICRNNQSLTVLNHETDTSYITLDGGDYLMAFSVSSVYHDDFRIIINSMGYTGTCGNQSAGSNVILPSCGDANTVFAILQADFVLPEPVGNLYGFWDVFSSAPLANFQQPELDPNVTAVFPSIPGEYGFYASDLGFGVGTYYYYLFSAANVGYENDKYVFDTTCLNYSLAVFQVLDSANAPCTVGIGEAEQPLAFSLYPNPASNSLHINLAQSQGTAYGIYNALGKLCLQGSISPAENNLSINVTTLAPGYYLFTVTSQTGQRTTKPFWVAK